MNTDKKTKTKATAAALALVPNYETPALNECAAQIAELHTVLERKTTRFFAETIYDIVELGACLNQVLAELRPPCETRFTQQPREGDGSYSNAGIGDFLSHHPALVECRIERRTAYNYMAAARNAGVKRPEDVGELRAQKALHGKKPTELYRLATPGAKAPQPAPLPDDESPLMRDLLRDLYRSLQQIRDWRDATSPAQFEAVCSELKATLEFLSGANWDMLPGERRPEGEHAEEVRP